jgi:hypothetical protein
LHSAPSPTRRARAAPSQTSCIPISAAAAAGARLRPVHSFRAAGCVGAAGSMATARGCGGSLEAARTALGVGATAAPPTKDIEARAQPCRRLPCNI